MNHYFVTIMEYITHLKFINIILYSTLITTTK